MTSTFTSAAEAITAADALLFTAGAGMGVDSGLPDFRGGEGFWRAYPPYRRLGLSFSALANPATFASNPHLAWGFYGHRLGLYRQATPHSGFGILRRWAGMMAEHFVFTSNVDGHFARAGFDEGRIVECHGSIHHLQCARPCSAEIWPADGVNVEVDESTMRAADPLPRCRKCGGLARPNILMFGDVQWVESRTEEQTARYERWIESLIERRRRVAVIECGAGLAIPTVRIESERIARRTGGRLIRINPREPQTPVGGVGIAMGAAEALAGIEALLH